MLRNIFIMNIFDNLSKYCEGTMCYLYIGKYNDGSVDCTVDETYYNKILDKIKNYVSRQYVKEQYKCYRYYDKELRIYKTGRIAIMKNPLHCVAQSNMCLALYDEQVIDLENFPVISKYTDICDIFTKMYNLKNISQVEICLTNEKSKDQSIYMVHIRFPIKYLDNVKKLTDCIFG